MLYVNTGNSHDPSLNLAAEEYVIRNIAPKDEILLFYINGPSIIIGRNQNTIQEINTDYVEEHNIKVVRRLSGGVGGRCITMRAISTFHSSRLTPKITSPTLKNSLSQSSRCSMRWAYLLNCADETTLWSTGKKISGNAQYVAGERMVSHGTLLWQTDLGRVGEALRVKAAKIESKGIKSVRSRVANISEFIQGDLMSIEAFRSRIIEGVFEGGDVREYVLTDDDWQAIQQLAQERYRNWDWNYGRSPAFDIRRETRYPGGEIEVYLDVVQGVIKDIKFYGDFFGQRSVDELEKALTNVQYTPPAIAKALENMLISDYFVNFSLEELISLLY